MALVGVLSSTTPLDRRWAAQAFTSLESKQSIIRALQANRPRSSFYTRAQKSAMSTVQSYIDQHSLQKNIEDVLNSCVKAKPEEPLTFMVRDAR